MYLPETYDSDDDRHSVNDEGYDHLLDLIDDLGVAIQDQYDRRGARQRPKR